MVSVAASIDRRTHQKLFEHGTAAARRLEGMSLQGPVSENKLEDLTAAQQLLGAFTLSGKVNEQPTAKPTPPGMRKHPITRELVPELAMEALMGPIGLMVGAALSVGRLTNATKAKAGGHYDRAAVAPAAVDTTPQSSFADWAAPISLKGGSLGRPTLSFDAFEEKRAQKIARELLARVERQVKGVDAMIHGPASIDLTVGKNMSERARTGLEGSHLAGLVHQGGMGNLEDTGAVSAEAIRAFTTQQHRVKPAQLPGLTMG